MIDMEKIKKIFDESNDEELYDLYTDGIKQKQYFLHFFIKTLFDLF